MNQEAVLGVLEGLATENDVDCILVANLSDGAVILDVVSGPGAVNEDGEDASSNPNAHLSFNQTYHHVSQLPLDGLRGAKGLVISAQYRDHLLVQFAHHKVAVTMTSRRTRGRCLGALLAVVPFLQSSEAFTKFASLPAHGDS